MITAVNHITLGVKDIERSFAFYRDVLGFKPLVKWEGSAYFLIAQTEQAEGFWFCLDRDSNRESTPCSTHYAFSVSEEDFPKMAKRVMDSGATIYKPNTSPGESLYFLDPDGHKLELHVGNWHSRLQAKKINPGKWRNIEWFV